MYIGIDLGTTSVKTVLVNKKGEVINTISKSYPLYNQKPLWSEQNPNQWYEQTIEALKELTQSYKKIEGISFSGQMHGLVILDEREQILRNAILWNDQRTAEEVKALNDALSLESIYSETNNLMLTGFTAPKVLWVKNHEPEIFNKISKIMLPKDYLIYKFTKNHATDYSDISGSGFYNIKKNKYADSIINYLGIKLNQLPKVYHSTDCVGKLDIETTKLLNLTQQPNIYAGGGDNAVSAIATGTIQEGDCMISLGTSGVIYTPLNDIKNFDSYHFHCFKDATEKYHAMGVTLSAAGSLEWYKQTFSSHLSFQKLMASVSADIENEVIFLPYLSGERTPINDPYAKGLLFGLSKKTNQDDITKAILEGVGFSLKHVFSNFNQQYIHVDQAKIIGGGSKNDEWVQIIADITQKNILTLKENDGASLGAAIIAIVGHNKDITFESVFNHIVHIKKCFKPREHMKTYYQNKYEKYLKLYEQTKNLL